MRPIDGEAKRPKSPTGLMSVPPNSSVLESLANLRYSDILVPSDHLKGVLCELNLLR